MLENSENPLPAAIGKHLCAMARFREPFSIWIIPLAMRYDYICVLTRVKSWWRNAWFPNPRPVWNWSESQRRRACVL